VPSAGAASAWARFHVWNDDTSSWLVVNPFAFATQSGAGTDIDSESGPWVRDISGLPLVSLKVRSHIEWNVAGAGNTSNMTSTITDWWITIPVRAILGA
jgi:hypothetical protein